MPPRRGFSLVEILVAMAIVAILAAVAVIGLSGLGGERELDREAARLKARLDHACETALLRGRAVGLALAADGTEYRFLEREAGQWTTATGAGLEDDHRLPAGMHLELRREGLEVSPPEDEGAARSPQLACLPSGELTPFVIRLEGSGAATRHLITGHPDMEIELRAETLRH